MPAADAYAVARELARVRARLDALERSVGGGDETLQPNYLTFDPATGRNGASFTGLINALGLILPAATSISVPTSQNNIQWQRTSDGAQVAQIWAGAAGGSEFAVLAANALGPTDNSTADLAAVDDLGTAQTELLVVQNARGNGQLLVKFQGVQTVIASLAGISKFAQLQTPGQGFLDTNGANMYTVSNANQANGSTNTQSFTTIRPSWTAAEPLGALLNCVVHGTTTAIAVPWSYTFTAPNTWNIVVTNQSGFAIDWTWLGLVAGK